MGTPDCSRRGRHSTQGRVLPRRLSNQCPKALRASVASGALRSLPRHPVRWIAAPSKHSSSRMGLRHCISCVTVTCCPWARLSLRRWDELYAYPLHAVNQFLAIDVAREQRMIMPMNSKSIIDRLVSLGYTQYEIAQESGVNRSTLSRLLRGLTAYTTEETQQKLMQASNKMRRRKRK